MSIVPQDPLLLDASVRENLDVAGERSDEEIWEALDSCSVSQLNSLFGFAYAAATTAEGDHRGFATTA